MSDLAHFVEEVETWIETREKAAALDRLASLFRRLALKAQDRSELLQHGAEKAQYMKSLRGYTRHDH